MKEIQQDLVKLRLPQSLLPTPFTPVYPPAPLSYSITAYTVTLATRAVRASQGENLTLTLGSVYAWTDWTSIRFSAYRYFFFLSDLAIASTWAKKGNEDFVDILVKEKIDGAYLGQFTSFPAVGVLVALVPLSSSLRAVGLRGLE